jgi:hypothetical protein
LYNGLIVGTQTEVAINFVSDAALTLHEFTDIGCEAYLAGLPGLGEDDENRIVTLFSMVKVGRNPGNTR